MTRANAALRVVDKEGDIYSERVTSSVDVRPRGEQTRIQGDIIVAADTQNLAIREKINQGRMISKGMEIMANESMDNEATVIRHGYNLVREQEYAAERAAIAEMVEQRMQRHNRSQQHLQNTIDQQVLNIADEAFKIKPKSRLARAAETLLDPLIDGKREG